MARRRDFEKMRRNEMVRSGGALPHWLDNWAPTNGDAVPYHPERISSVAPRQQKSHSPKSTLLTWDIVFTNHTVSLNLPPMILENTKELLPARTIAASKVTFVLHGLLDSAEQELFAKAMRIKVGERFEPSDFNRLLNQLMYIRQTSECDGHVTYEYERKSILHSPKGIGMSAKMIKAALLKEKPHLTAKALRDAVQSKLRSQNQ